MKGIFGHPERYIDLIGEPFVKAAQQRSSAGQEDSPVDYVSIQFGWCLFEHLQDGGFDLGERLVEAVGYLLV